MINYWGIVAPAGTPRDIGTKLNAEVQKLLAQGDVRARLEREGAELVSGPPERLGTMIERDLTSRRKLIAEARLALQ